MYGAGMGTLRVFVELDGGEKKQVMTRLKWLGTNFERSILLISPFFFVVNMQPCIKKIIARVDFDKSLI